MSVCDTCISCVNVWNLILASFKLPTLFPICTVLYVDKHGIVGLFILLQVMIYVIR